MAIIYDNKNFIKEAAKCREYLFRKVVLIYQEKATPRSNYFLENYDWGVGISL